MRFHHRIRTIYCKELVDILRDRRTLIAMIVVPIVLYPLLMLGSIQAVSYQMESVGEEPLIAGVIGERQGVTLHRLIEMDKRALAQTRARLDPESAEFNDLPTPIDNTGIRAFASREHLVEAVRRRVVRLGVIFEGDVWIRNFERTNEVEFLSDREDLRSSLALQRIEEMFERLKEQAVHQRKQALGLPDTFDKPFALTVTDLSTPSSLLGQILPLILILMTITGAIYPAIDLTAGERERGTLESLMVCPVPIIDLIVGKFLVVATVAIMGAALNLASVSATFWFGGFNKMIAGGGGIPVSTMGLILLCLIPFAVLMSAIMIAVCSYARTFKEAQNYVTPVILAVLIPGGIAALPATRFEGVMLVMPVGNMVLLARELLLDTAISFGQVGMVLISTTLYAGAAVAVAASVFGKESVIFADAGSLRSTLARKLIKPSAHPTVSMGLLVTALLFPAWFYVQASLSPDADATTVVGVLYGTGRLMPIFFILVPVGILVYFKVNIRNTFALRMPTGRHLLAGVLIGVSAFVPARELSIVQRYLIGIPEIVQKNAEMLGQTLASLPLTHALLLVAVVPAICEELLFRGFLLGALRNTNSSHSVRKWSAILVSAAVFGVFHFFVFKFPVTAALGAVLGYLCWQSRSILPVIIAHMLHNGIGTLSAIRPTWFDWMTTPNADEWAHLPLRILIPGLIIFTLGLALASRPVTNTSEQQNS